MTPHINANKDEIAKVVLMPGNSLRAKTIAEKYLTDLKLINKVRNMLMYTGKYQDIEVTIAGSYNPDIKVYDIFNVKEAFGESNYAKIAANIYSNLIAASEKLFTEIEAVAQAKGIKTHTGVAVFYRYDDSLAFITEHNLDVVEMGIVCFIC
ncbi:hypothetical protein [Spiroplasma endosymbiont of Polydrusus pterygomalis]|uniref:hypothetical protein n=1 Tax=Spiroplasma endosymbiont of Polydrusus pterygomalis TaxID=3139327 RepID=UPI003CCB05BE